MFISVSHYGLKIVSSGSNFRIPVHFCYLSGLLSVHVPFHLSLVLPVSLQICYDPSERVN